MWHEGSFSSLNFDLVDVLLQARFVQIWPEEEHRPVGDNEQCNNKVTLVATRWTSSTFVALSSDFGLPLVA